MMTTTIAPNTRAALLRQELDEVDRKIQKATDPAYTVLSEKGVGLLAEYRSELDQQLVDIETIGDETQQQSDGEPNLRQLALCEYPELQYASSTVLTGRPQRPARKGKRQA